MKRLLSPSIPAGLIVLIGLSLSLCLSAPAAAQDYTWTLSAMGGIGSAVQDGGGSDTGFQLGFGLQFEPDANVWVHAGQLGFDTDAVTDGTIQYVNVGGEYQFREDYYTSGFFIGLGAYDLESRRIFAPGVFGPAESETALGLVIGATGEFKFTPSFVFLVEITGHILDSDDVRVLGTAHAGFGIHF